jgi:hypothetical protein
MLAIHASLKLAGAGGSPGGSPHGALTEVASWCTNIDQPSAINEIDATPYQPGVPVPVKVTEAGFDDQSFVLTVKHETAAWAFFSILKGVTGLAYEYSPAGTSLGDPLIEGYCNVLQIGTPKGAPEALLTFEVRLRCTTMALTIH